MIEGLSEDEILGGRVRIVQKKRGYRVAIDPVLLAAAVAGEPGQSVLDLGAGVGAAALCLAVRVPAIAVTGLEADPFLVELANGNAALSGLSHRVSFVEGDLLAPPQELQPGSFDHVMANPPFIAAGTGRTPTAEGKARATMEGAADLCAWVRFCAQTVRPGGSVTVIHRADRLDDVLATVAPSFGGVRVLPLWPAAGRPAKRVIVVAQKGARTPLQLLPGLVLHRPDGRFTADAERVLRDAQPLSLGSNRS